MRFRFAIVALLTFAGDVEQHAGTHPDFSWQGDVQDVCVLKVHQDQVEATDGEGNPIPHARYKFWSKLPDTNQTLSVEVLQGRGAVRFLSQPNLENEYTATIRIE